jgi:hypothetical protein
MMCVSVAFPNSRNVAFSFLVGLVIVGFCLPGAVAQKSRKPLAKGEVIELLENGAAPARIIDFTNQYGIAFEITPTAENELRQAGATDELLKSLREISARPSAAPAPAPATAPAPAPAPSPPENAADVYKAMLGAMTGQGEAAANPNVKSSYVTHQHGGGGFRALGYGSGGRHGSLLIADGRIQFSSNSEDHAFDVAANEVSEVQLKSNHLRMQVKGRKYHFVTQDRGMFGGAGQGPGAMRWALESIGLKPKE